MSETFENPEELLNDDHIGETSAESVPDEVGQVTARKKRGPFNIYDAMMMVSLVCISLATVLLFWELFKFGDLSGFPWKTAEFQVK